MGYTRPAGHFQSSSEIHEHLGSERHALPAGVNKILPEFSTLSCHVDRIWHSRCTWRFSGSVQGSGRSVEWDPHFTVRCNLIYICTFHVYCPSWVQNRCKWSALHTAYHLYVFAKIEAEKAVLLSWGTIKLHTCTVKRMILLEWKGSLVKFMYYVTDYSICSAVFTSWYCTTSDTLVYRQ
jgi:hypothetical protein